MRMQAAVVGVVAAVALFAAPLTGSAQETRHGSWVVVSTTDDFTDETTTFARTTGDTVILGVTCLAGGYGALLSLNDGGTFANGVVETRWDGGEVDRFQFQDRNDNLLGWSSLNAGVQGWMPDFFAKLRQHSELRLRVTKWRDERVAGRISLSGSDAAISALGCG